MVLRGLQRSLLLGWGLERGGRFGSSIKVEEWPYLKALSWPITRHLRSSLTSLLGG